MAFGLPESLWQHIHGCHPLDCQEAQASFSAYRQGSMELYADQRVMLHIANCDGCRDEYQTRHLMMGNGRVAANGRGLPDSSADRRGGL
ncbi:MAG: hypothetical protein Q8R35_00935 [bacterium]|nr:hypothetical protein [bacterium]